MVYVRFVDDFIEIHASQIRNIALQSLRSKFGRY